MTNLDSIFKAYNFTDKVLYSQSYGFSTGHVRIWESDHKEDSAKELMLSNCGAKDYWESFGQPGDQISQS